LTGANPTACRGDLASYCNSPEITKELVEWAKKSDDGDCPRSVEDLQEPQSVEVLAGLAEMHHIDRCVDATFAGTEEAAAEPEHPILDGVYSPEDEANPDAAEAHDAEQELLEQIPLPGNPESEQARKRAWLALPRRARITIRRLHRNFRHLPKNALVQGGGVTTATLLTTAAARACAASAGTSELTPLRNA
jgi:hypothetical protein